MASGLIIVPNYMPALDGNGRPYAGALMYFYVNGTTTPQAVYSDSGLTTPLTNPVEADYAGEFPAIYADTSLLYSVAVTTSTGAPLATYSGIGAAITLASIQAALDAKLDKADFAVYYPEDYGAVGDGVADDYPAFAAISTAIGTVASGGAGAPTVIKLREGATYLHSSGTWKIQQNYVTVMGCGANVRNTKSGSPALQIDHNDSINSPTGITVLDLNLEASNTTNAHGLVAKSAPQLTLRNVRVKNLSDPATETLYGCGGRGIWLTGCVSYYLERCQVDKPKGIGILVDTYIKTWNSGSGGPVYAESQGGTLKGCRVFKSDSVGIIFVDGGGHKAHLCDIESNAGNGLEVRASYDFTLFDNYFEVNTTDIAIRNTGGIAPGRAVQGGYIGRNQCESTTGVLLDAVPNIVVENNRISGNATIASGSNDTLWCIQTTLSGTLSDSGTRTNRLDVFPRYDKSASAGSCGVILTTAKNPRTRFASVGSDDAAISVSTNGVTWTDIVKIGNASTLGFFGVTPVAQPTNVGNTATAAAGSTTTTYTNTTFTGGIGSAGYTIGDIVRALKLLGIITS